MNWEAISAVGEMIGAAAVVLSLIYLAVQVRQNTRVARAATRQGVTDSAAVGGRLLAESDELASLYLRHGGGESLNSDEQLRLMGLIYMTTRNWENIHYQFRSGMLTEREWGAFRENLRLLFQTPVFVDYWNREQGIYTAEFREEVDALLREIEAGRTHDETSALFKKPEVGT